MVQLAVNLLVLLFHSPVVYHNGSLALKILGPCLSFKHTMLHCGNLLVVQRSDETSERIQKEVDINSPARSLLQVLQNSKATRCTVNRESVRLGARIFLVQRALAAEPVRLGSFRPPTLSSNCFCSLVTLPLPCSGRALVRVSDPSCKEVKVFALSAAVR